MLQDNNKKVFKFTGKSCQEKENTTSKLFEILITEDFSYSPNCKGCLGYVNELVESQGGSNDSNLKTNRNADTL